MQLKGIDRTVQMHQGLAHRLKGVWGPTPDAQRAGVLPGFCLQSLLEHVGL